MKKKTIASVKKKLWEVFSRCIRTRDCLLTTGSPEYGECFTCDDTMPFKELQAGHFVPKHSNNYFSERGVHAQCKQCNLYGKNNQPKGMPLEYYAHMVELYGEEVAKELKSENLPYKKFTIPELEELMVYYKEKLRALEE